MKNGSSKYNTFFITFLLLLLFFSSFWEIKTSDSTKINFRGNKVTDTDKIQYQSTFESQNKKINYDTVNITTPLFISNRTVFTNETIRLQSNINVLSGGTLELVNSNLYFICSRSGEFSVSVESGGALNVTQGSTILSWFGQYRGIVEIKLGGNLTASSSKFRDLGYDSYYFNDILIEGKPGLSIKGNSKIIKCDFIGCVRALELKNNVEITTVQNCTFINSRQFAIYITSSDVVVEYCKISYGSYYGVFAGNGASNVTIQKCSIKNTYFGISLIQCSNSRIINNSFEYNYYGLYCGDVSSVTLKDNEILNTFYYAIFLQNAAHCAINMNTIVYINIFAIVFQNSSGIWVENNVIWNATVAIRFEETTTNNFLVGNYIGNSDRSVEIDATSGGNKIWFNSFFNVKSHANDTSRNNIWHNATVGNYWGGFKVKDRNKDLIGDNPYVTEQLIDKFPLMVPHVEYAKMINKENSQNQVDYLYWPGISLAFMTLIFMRRKK